MEALLVGVLVLTGISLLTGVRVLREYERGVVFRLGRARKSLPGRAWSCCCRSASIAHAS